MHHHHVQCARLKSGDLLWRAYFDCVMAFEAQRERSAHLRGCFTQHETPRRRCYQARVQRLAAAVVEDLRAGRDMLGDVACDGAIVDVAMPGIDVDRMLGIPEGDPFAHHSIPRWSQVSAKPCLPGKRSSVSLGRMVTQRSLRAGFFHHLDETCEQIMAVAWSRRRLRVILNREYGLVLERQSAIRSVKQ